MMKMLLSDKKLSSAWWRQLERGVMVSWLESCMSAWGSYVDVDVDVYGLLMSS